MKEKTKKVLKQLALYICVFFILIGIYMLSLTLTSMIPSSLLKNHVIQSSETLEEDGEKVLFDLKYKKECIFTFTDALMINTAYSIDSNHPVESFILARKNYIPGQTKQVYGDSQYNLGANEKYVDKAKGDLYQTKELYGLMHGENIEDSYEYARYWHGYLALLRPLLVLGNYGAIRIILFVLTLICIVTMLILLGRKTNWINSFIYAIGLLSIHIFIVSQSINESLIFLVAFISNIILLIKNEKIKNIGVFFFIVGSISSFIDLLTAPIVTLGLTAITYFLLLQKKEEISIKKYIVEILKIGITWSLGYGITWISKWIITELFFNRPIISQAIEQVLYRTNQVEYNGILLFTPVQVIMKNIKFLSTSLIFGLLGIGIIYMVVVGIKNFKEEISFKDNIKKCIPYIIIFCFPIVWYIALKQHSYIHSFFTYRILVISIICLLIIFSKILEKKKKKEEL